MGTVEIAGWKALMEVNLVRRAVEAQPAACFSAVAAFPIGSQRTTGAMVSPGAA